MKDETGCVVIEEFVGLKHKRFSFLVDNNEHKKAKGVNKNVGETIGHNEYKDLFLENTLQHQIIVPPAYYFLDFLSEPPPPPPRFLIWNPLAYLIFQILFCRYFRDC